MTRTDLANALLRPLATGRRVASAEVSADAGALRFPWPSLSGRDGASASQAEHRFAVSVPADAAMLVEVRRAVAAELGLWGIREYGDAMLVVSELVANAVAHGSCLSPGVRPAKVDLEITVRGQLLRIAVTDNRPDEVPVVRSASEEAERGRGLALVEALADTWDTTVGDGRKTVWACLPLSAAPAPVSDRNN